MGCGSSKVDQSKPVSLCRERRERIATAVDRRYALAAAHAAYFDSLAAVGDALQRFVQEELTVASSSPTGSPVLTLPSSDGKRKTKRGRGSASAAASVSSSASPLSHSLSRNGSHLPLSDISESETDPDGGDGGASEAGGGRGAAVAGDGGRDSSTSPRRHISSSSNSSFLKSSMEIPQTVYQDPLASPWSNSPYNGDAYGFGYPPYDAPFGFKTPARDETYGPPTPTLAPATPPPPSPAKTSGWEFLDPFNMYEHFLHHYSQGKLRMGSFTSSPDLREVRKQEGIPDLEFEMDVKPMKEAKKENVQAKKVNLEVKKENVLDNGLEGKDFSVEKLSAVPAEDVGRKDAKDGIVGLAKEGRKNSWASSKGRSIREDEKSNGKDRVMIFYDKSYETEESAPQIVKSLSTSEQSFFLHATRDVVDVVKEIKKQFTSAADCGEEVSKMLEGDRFPYPSRSKRFGDISSRILDPITLPVPLPFKRQQQTNMSSVSREAGNCNPENNDIVESGNLSSTLEKLYLWEQKLYKEVKDEEKLRIIYDKKYKHLKALHARGAEPSEINMTQVLVRKLHTKISVIIKSVDSISNRMHKIRDEELQPQLTELIQGFIRMWKTVLICHQKQLQAIVNTTSRKLVVKTRSQKESIAKATKELELELVNWYQCFNNWIGIQKSYIEALNGWLISWLPQEQEQTPDGVAPFSPGGIGAPAVYVLSNDWFHANKNISGKEVIKSMRAFIKILHILLESQEEEQRQRLEAEYLSGAYDRRLGSLQEKGRYGHLDIVSVTKDGLEHHDDGIVELDLLRKKLDEKIYKHKEALRRIKHVASSALQTGLTPLFGALEDFTSQILRAYDGLRIPNDGGET
ncbi:protein ROLLING AND ERECT LEAF 2-like isoform X1 [Musa acuminata AAA Group]|uniref:protein ROLLING AND ERECT LEAF 2-like isoform X1 n=1 Tax=Musa acuminata AAA Group TaxID=214697 RepID=UPI0031D5060B